MLDLDGRTLEGGGQLLRLSLCLCALTGSAITINHIRGRRSSGGGLKAQHLACVEWLARANNAAVDGAELKSKRITFTPVSRSAVPPSYTEKALSSGGRIFQTTLDVGSPGSVGLALQAALPFIFFSPPVMPTDSGPYGMGTVELTIQGGTNVPGSPSYEYIKQVLIPTLSLVGVPPIEAILERRGWSTGRAYVGSVKFAITPLSLGSVLPAFTIDSPDPTKHHEQAITRIDVTVLAPPSVWSHIREVTSSAIASQFEGRCSEAAEILHFSFEDSEHEKRLYLIMVATLTYQGKDYKLASDCLYQRKIKSLERAATEAVEEAAGRLADQVYSGTLVDEHMRDQLVVFQALANGKSKVRGGRDEDGEAVPSSLHAQTAEWVAREVLGVKLKNGVGVGIGFPAGGRCSRQAAVEGLAAGFAGLRV